jgi:hypothetical protein
MNCHKWQIKRQKCRIFREMFAKLQGIVTQGVSWVVDVTAEDDFLARCDQKVNLRLRFR